MTVKYFTSCVPFLVLPVAMAGIPELPQFSEEELSLYDEQTQEYYRWSETFLSQLNYQDGEISLPGGSVRLLVPENFYYLSPEDSEKVLVEAWGNMPSNELPMGMLFPADYHPLRDEAWGMIINYSNDGHVADKDAANIDYDDLLKQIRKDTEAENEYRMQEGYGKIELVGWAASPYYDSEGKKLHWAQEYRFDDSEHSTLNYKIRVLGREGVLELNAIAGMDQLVQVNDSLDTVLQIAQFTEGNTYADFDPKLDKVAAYGIGGLIAGKVLAKTGVLATFLLFFKKFFVVGIVAIGALFKSIFGRGKKSE